MKLCFLSCIISLIVIVTCRESFSETKTGSSLSANGINAYSEFLVLENDLLKALQSGDENLAAKVLDSNFEYIYSDQFGQVNTAVQLLNDDSVKRWGMCRIGSFEVRKFENNLILNFVLEEILKNRKTIRWSVQDFWVMKNGNWLLRYRFISPSRLSEKLPPGYIKQEVIEKKY